MIGANILVVIGVLLLTLILYVRQKLSYWSRRGVHAEPTTFLIGNSTNLLLQKKSFGDEIQDYYKRLKELGLDYGGYYAFLKPVLVTADLDLIRNIMTKDFQHFMDHTGFVDEDLEPLTGHLFNLRGSRWKHMRTKLSPTFTSGKMKLMFQMLEDASVYLKKVLEKLVETDEPVDIKEVSARFTTDIIMSCAFGIEANCQKDPNSEFRKYGAMMFDRSIKEAFVRLIAIECPELLSFLRINPLPKEPRNFFKNLTRSVVEHREKNNVIRKDFIHLLIQLKNNVKIDQNETGELKQDGREDKSMTMDELTAQAFVFWLAGFETSSTTTTFCMYEMTRNLDIQEKLRTEICNVLERHEGKATYAALQEMTYMDRCINETLRKYPPVPVHSRLCTERYHIPNSKVILDKGDSVFIPVLGIQRDPDIYPDPEKFDPERFSQENIARRHPSAWTPFGDGPRLCIGLRFGMMQTKMALVTMLKNFKFTLNEKTRTPLRFDPTNFILTADRDIMLNIEKI